MTDFRWGEPHPLAIDPRRRKRGSDERAVQRFGGVLSAVGILFARGGDEAKRGLDLFDREAANIRHWQAWAARGVRGRSR